MQIYYYADDGTAFTNQEECELYEKELADLWSLDIYEASFEKNRKAN